MVARVAREFLPAELRAFGSYLASSGDVRAIPMALLQREIDDEMDAITDEIFRHVEAELDRAIERGEVEPADGSGRGDATFGYDTRLLLPAMITYGYVRTVAGDVPFLKRLPGQSVDWELRDTARKTTYSITQALLDGDMRDAINDEEFEDFETNLRPKRRVAELAQEHLQSEVTTWLEADETPESVRRHYQHAVDVSESHQDDDPEFRSLFERLRETPRGERDAVAEEVREKYTYASPEDEPTLFAQESSLPYFTTQYERVGIIYEDMLGMYEGDIGIDISDDFKRAVVLMVIAAQVGLDDTDDYPEDRLTQLTPVTAELSLTSTSSAGIDTLEEIIEAYVTRAEVYSPDPITSIAIEYIRQQSLQKLAELREEIPQ